MRITKSPDYEQSLRDQLNPRARLERVPLLYDLLLVLLDRD